MELTPAGQAVRLALPKPLESGGPIRWTPERLQTVSESLGSQKADFLFLYFIETLKEKAKRWGQHLERVSRVDRALGERFEDLKRAADTVLGDPLPYGPVLYPTDGLELGLAWAKGGFNMTGLAVRESGRGAAGSLSGISHRSVGSPGLRQMPP